MAPAVLEARRVRSSPDRCRSSLGEKRGWRSGTLSWTASGRSCGPPRSACLVLIAASSQRICDEYAAPVRRSVGLRPSTRSCPRRRCRPAATGLPCCPAGSATMRRMPMRTTIRILRCTCPCPTATAGPCRTCCQPGRTAWRFRPGSSRTVGRLQGAGQIPAAVFGWARSLWPMAASHHLEEGSAVRGPHGCKVLGGRTRLRRLPQPRVKQQDQE